jgi:hypothetical protein
MKEWSVLQGRIKEELFRSPVSFVDPIEAQPPAVL